MNSTLTHMPLRGREREMRLIREVLEYGRRSGPAVLSIEGMPGIGKTRLLQEAAALADGLGYAGHHPDPWADPRHLRRRTVPARHTRGRPGRCHAPAGPVLVLVDDTRRAVDGPPRMPFAPRERPGGEPVVWLVAHRPGEAPALPAGLTGRSERLSLGPLGPAHSLSLARDLLGAPPAPALVQLIDQAGGHPRLLIELLTGLQEEGALETVDDEVRLLTSRLPARLATRVRATLERFSPGCRQLLCVASLLGCEVVYEDLALMLRTSVSALLPALEEVEATGVVRNDDGRAVFSSPLLRRLISDSMPDSLRLSLQREAAALRATAGLGEAPAAGPELSEQQRVLVGLVREGLTNQQIARRLALSPHTVNYHLRKLFKTFGVSSRIDLLTAAEHLDASGRAARARQN
ncbi:LuxR C-terminal-related transcriptional regulator [Streptomyces sp. NBC_00047]|uniref:helix-turn-helix transcriptional regulator n=1 Tax=Streptomyces sp. NBC_00047 TaxID=2975627 RepID=UPI002257773D|nr:LuxR family transcriptional regulator [Streptomyces sp. NBC_00047]MCX5611525.1 LuxR C-terminal-related transcriptional regulator [Streptomyces sp. NBC_00047]